MPKRKSPAVNNPKARATPAPAGSNGWSVFACIAAATLVAYLPALAGGLVWDDTGHVTRADLRSLHGLWRIWFDFGATQQYYPLLHSFFWLEHALWGDSVLGYHLANLALHTASACLVVAIVRRLRLPGAWLAGLLFALHPIAVEAVAWISEQKSTLSAAFYLAAALLYLDFHDSRRRSRYAIASALFVLALASKTVTATLPAALLVILWWRDGKLTWKRHLQPLAPWFAIGAASGLFTAWFEKTYIGASGAGFALTPLQRLLLAGRVIWFYAAKLVWPVNLTFLYPHWRIDAGQWWQYLFPVGIAAVTLWLWRLAPRHRGPLAGFLFFAGTLFPVLGFFNVYPFRYSYVADHFAYLAILGLLVPAAVLAATRLPKPWMGAILPAVLALLTFRQAGMYKDEETLYRATIERNPDAFLASNNLGNLLLRIPGRGPEALQHIQDALRANPDYWEGHLSLGNALFRIPGRLDDALREFQTAARLAPNEERPHTNLGNALLETGRTREAIAQYHLALQLQPASATAHSDLANAWTRLPGHTADAIAEYEAALRSSPDFAEAHNDLGHVLAQTPARLGDAIAHLQTAIRLRPAYWDAHTNLAITLSKIPGSLPAALAEFQTAARLRPDSAESHSNLGYALSQFPERLPDAAAEYRRALQFNPNYAEAHYSLASVLMNLPGRQAEALAEYQAALRLQPTPELQQIVAQLRARQNAAK